MSDQEILEMVRDHFDILLRVMRGQRTTRKERDSLNEANVSVFKGLLNDVIGRMK